MLAIKNAEKIESFIFVFLCLFEYVEVIGRIMITKRLSQSIGSTMWLLLLYDDDDMMIICQSFNSGEKLKLVLFSCHHRA